MSNERITDEEAHVLGYVMCLLEDEIEIGHYYPIPQQLYSQLRKSNFRVITYADHSKSFDKINDLMILLMDELLEHLQKSFLVNKKEISMLLRVLHNLPRVYLGESLETLCNLRLPSITCEDACEYATLNMDEKTRQKYSAYIIK